MTYGCEITTIPADLLRSCDAAALKAWWGKKRCHRAAEVAWTLFTKVHLTQPSAAVHWTRLSTMRRVLRNMPHLRGLYERVWELRVTTNRKAYGPVSHLHDTVEALGLDWRSTPWGFHRPNPAPESSQRPAPGRDMVERYVCQSR